MAGRVMMGLGGYRFSLKTAAFQELTRVTEFGWTPVDIAASMPHMQRANLGSDTINLKGVIFTAYKGTIWQPEAMRAQGHQGVPMPLITGYGQWLGMWCIISLSESGTNFISVGAPKRQEFDLTLQMDGASN